MISSSIVKVNLPSEFLITNCSDLSGESYLSNNEEIFTDPKNPTYPVKISNLNSCGTVDGKTLITEVQKSSIKSLILY